jgi:hypothetical protein
MICSSHITHIVRSGWVWVPFLLSVGEFSWQVAAIPQSLSCLSMSKVAESAIPTKLPKLTILSLTMGIQCRGAHAYVSRLRIKSSRPHKELVVSQFPTLPNRGVKVWGDGTIKLNEISQPSRVFIYGIEPRLNGVLYIPTQHFLHKSVFGWCNDRKWGGIPSQWSCQKFAMDLSPIVISVAVANVALSVSLHGSVEPT